MTRADNELTDWHQAQLLESQREGRGHGSDHFALEVEGSVSEEWVAEALRLWAQEIWESPEERPGPIVQNRLYVFDEGHLVNAYVPL